MSVLWPTETTVDYDILLGQQLQVQV